MLRIPDPPKNLDPEVRQYLSDLVNAVRAVLAELDGSMQKKGDPVVLPIASVADLTAVPARFRPGQENRLVFCPNAQAGGGALGISYDDGGGAIWHEVTLGPEVS